MNISKRLKKMEIQIIKEDSEFCICNGKEPQVEVCQKEIKYDACATGKYVPYQESETAAQSHRETENEKPTPEDCQRCGKPINKRLIILNLVG
jgi:predicted ATP-binding protein involved in virulence